MTVTLQRAHRDARAHRGKHNKVDVKPPGIGLGEGFEAAFAVCVMLGALWMLVSGYA